MNNTIFDDVFRTMIEKMSYLAVPLINEVFHTSYPEDVKITQLRNEHQQKDGEIITDSCLLIGKKMYHIECQSTDDTTMAIRMIEYDFAIAVENAEKQGRRYRIEFPRSCVLFLRSSGNTPDYLEADVIFACGPAPMLRAIKAYGLEKGIPCWISMEEKMACGVGACLACVCQSTEVDGHSHVHNKRICKDGPVFLSTEIEL